jgi:hypothetical protein
MVLLTRSFPRLAVAALSPQGHGRGADLDIRQPQQARSIPPRPDQARGKGDHV